MFAAGVLGPAVASGEKKREAVLVKRLRRRMIPGTSAGSGAPAIPAARKGLVALVVPMILVVVAALLGLGRPRVLDAVKPAAAGTPSFGPGIACAPLDVSKVVPGSRVKATVMLGSTVATLEGTAADAWGLPALGASALTIHEGDALVWSGPLHPPAGWEGPDETVMLTGIQNPTASSPGGESAMLPLCVARFAGSDHAATLVGLYTGGAHCCTIVRALALGATNAGAGAAVDVQIGNPGVDVRGLGDRAIVVTGDDVFNYEFNAFASSGVPIKVLELRAGTFADTTREHPDLVRSDMAGWWKAFNDDAPGGLGFLAAWMADKCLLNEGPDAWATVGKLLAGGKLAGPAAPPGNTAAGDIWPAGDAYVAKLHSFLPEHGYCK